MKIVKAYTRHYCDNGHTGAYVEWEDGSCTEGDAVEMPDTKISRFGGRTTMPVGVHMQSLFNRAIREGLTIGRERWR